MENFNTPIVAVALANICGNFLAYLEVLYVEHLANKEVMIHSNSQLSPEARAGNDGGRR